MQRKKDMLSVKKKKKKNYYIFRHVKVGSIAQGAHLTVMWVKRCFVVI